MKSLGVDLSVPILICPGTLFKYAPLYDRVFVEIAKRLGKCKFMFFVQQKWQASLFNERLRRRFDTEDLDFDEFVLFAPWLTREEFCGLMQRAHVFLETIGFSGFNTAMQAVDCALPIVTREGRFLRGRLASGILKRIGMPELVVSTEEEYVRLVVRLVEDKEYREKVRKQIRNGREILYDDLEPVRALESFLTDMCRPST
jgi:predicted O-linked N-acetylglucosamine transferase (SPINDLY family)